METTVAVIKAMASFVLLFLCTPQSLGTARVRGHLTVCAWALCSRLSAFLKVTSKSFKFPEQHNLPFFFVSAADGTNVVKVFEQTLEEAIRHRDKVGPPCPRASSADMFSRRRPYLNVSVPPCFLPADLHTPMPTSLLRPPLLTIFSSRIHFFLNPH
jgi:hypothetical protein